MRCHETHKHVNEYGIGACSVPMWQMGLPAGFCDKDAYGERPSCKMYRDGWTGREFRADGKYSGHVPFLACPGHGGPTTRVYKDGNMWCAVEPDFINLQESPAGFGETPEAARTAIRGELMATTEVVEAEIVDMPMELTVFDPIDVKLAEAKKKNANLVFDYEDKKGNKEARSWVAHLRTFKAPVNEMHKTGKAEARKYCDEWDRAKNKRITAIEEMIEHHDKPLREIKEREAAKKAEQERIAQEKADAEEATKQAELEAREKAVADKEAKLEAEQREIDQKAREARAALEAKKEAEYQAKRDLEAAENRRIADVQAAENKAAAEAAEKDRKLAEDKRIQEVEEQRQRKIEEERKANLEHRRAINKEVYNALFTAVGDPAAKMAFNAIYEGKVPHVTIQFKETLCFRKLSTH